MTSIILLTTKIHIPPTPHTLTPRPRLVQTLEQSLRPGHKLTALLAPAGFGKTMLLSEWIDRRWCRGSASCRVAWVGLDEGDNDPLRCLTYIIASLQTVEPHLGAAAMNALQDDSPLEEVLDLLLNDLARCIEPVVLALDDYHLIESRAVHDVLAYLLEHLPPDVHLILASRADPPLPLARLRGRRQLSELRMADLRFNRDETQLFLNEMMGLALAPAQIEALEGRTEGWIAGLQLAALSLQDRPDAAAFIDAFTGSHRFILDYLTEEVLNKQAAARRDFLLRTSILNRMTGSLCDRLTGRRDGYETLIDLERQGLFLISLDDERCWYRYHHLFGDLLRSRLQHLYPDELSVLHHHAATWFAQQGLTDEARQHDAAASAGETPDSPPSPQHQPLAPLHEPLSPRELEVLNLLATGLTNREIAARLFIEAGTVKRHTANIYGKLNVNNRTQAVAIARELHLL